MTSISRATSALVRNAGSLAGNLSAGGHSQISICRRIPVLARQSSSSTTPKRPSPYRLIPLPTFLADFAPLHVNGWRLELLPGVRPNQPPQDDGMAQLQDRRLVRRYDFEQGKDGWRKLMAFTHTLGEVVEKEDHHPTILISPAGDYLSTTGDVTPISDTAGYVVAVSTHTHTPLPPVKFPKAKDGSQEAMRPGVTGKDLRLAITLEEIYGDSTA